MAPTISLILDLIIAGLLVATISYAILLNRRLVELQESRAEMEGLIRNFNEATGRAEAGIKGMKRAAFDTGESLQKTVERGQVLRDELQFMIEAADALAQRLAQTPTASRSAPAAPMPSRQPAPEPMRAETRRLPEPDRDQGRRERDRERGGDRVGDRVGDREQDLPRGRGALVRPDAARAASQRPPDMDDSQDLPRGRGFLARLDPGRLEPRSEPARAEPARRSRPEPGERPLLTDDSRPSRRESAEGLSRAERELLEAMESRR